MNVTPLNALNLDNVGSWPFVIKLGVFLGLGLGVLVLGYSFLIKAHIETYQTLKQQEQALKSAFESKQKQASNLKAYTVQMKQLNQRFDAMLKWLPAQDEMPGLLEDISKKGLFLGLKFELFAPQPEIVHDFYVELPIKVTVVGTYMQLATFVSSIAEMKLLVTLNEFTIRKQGDHDSQDELVMNSTAKIYRYRIK